MFERPAGMESCCVRRVFRLIHGLTRSSNGAQLKLARDAAGWEEGGAAVSLMHVVPRRWR